VSGLWKENWEETKERFVKWWHHNGTVIGLWGDPDRAAPRVPVADPGPASSFDQQFTDHEWRAQADRHYLAYQEFPLDKMPLVNVGLGPGSLCLLLGSIPKFQVDTAWYSTCIDNIDNCPSLVFDPSNQWWLVQERILKEQMRINGQECLVGCPDLVENIDILCSLRGTQKVMIDLLTEPEWVKRKIAEINGVFFDAYDRIYDIIKAEDGSSVFRQFCLWAPGKVAKVQADASAMISPDQFVEFVVPALREQCQRLDYSMFHLDGTQCIPHLDHLLEIEELDAVEWTPQAGLPQGGDPCWHDMYRRIIEAGKSVQAVSMRPDEVVPMLNAVGTEGIYALVDFTGSDSDITEFTASLSRYL